MKKLSAIFMIVAIILSDVMCFVVAFNYRSLLCDIEHGGASAPASIAFLCVIPYALVIAVCVILSMKFKKM